MEGQSDREANRVGLTVGGGVFEHFSSCCQETILFLNVFVHFLTPDQLSSRASGSTPGSSQVEVIHQNQKHQN